MKLTQGPIADWLKPWVSLWLTIHLFALVACLAANRTTSELGRRLVRLLAPHSVVLHQDYGGVPLGMTQGDAVDCDHQLEIHLAATPAVAADPNAKDDKDASGSWQSLEASASHPERAYARQTAFIDRRWQNLERMLAVAANEKNEEIVHLCFDYALKQWPLETREQIDGIRLIRKPVLSVAQHALIERGELPKSELDSITLFECSVVKLSGDRIKLVPILEKTRRSKTLRSQSESIGQSPANQGAADGAK